LRHRRRLGLAIFGGRADGLLDPPADLLRVAARRLLADLEVAPGDACAAAEAGEDPHPGLGPLYADREFARRIARLAGVGGAGRLALPEMLGEGPGAGRKAEQILGKLLRLRAPRLHLLHPLRRQ